MKLLCICHANICRSFMAQEFFKQLLPNATICSRGLYADPAYRVPSKVKEALTRHHILFTKHTATLLTAGDLHVADLVFCMEKKHEMYLLDRYAQHTDKIWLLTEFANQSSQDITDPISLEGKAFQKAADALYNICQTAATRIKQDFKLQK